MSWDPTLTHGTVSQILFHCNVLQWDLRFVQHHGPFLRPDRSDLEGPPHANRCALPQTLRHPARSLRGFELCPDLSAICAWPPGKCGGSHAVCPSGSLSEPFPLVLPNGVNFPRLTTGATAVPPTFSTRADPGTGPRRSRLGVAFTLHSSDKLGFQRSEFGQIAFGFQQMCASFQ